MGWKNKLTRTPYLVLFVVLIAIGVGTASAIITITLSGNVVITGDLDMTNDKIRNLGAPTQSSDAATKEYVDSSNGSDSFALLNCADDQLIKWNGTHWKCVKLFAKHTPITTIDNTGDVGEYTSIAIGIDDNPVISYYDGTNFDLKVAHCGNPICSLNNIITTVDSTGDVGKYTSIAIGIDGNPVISYWDDTNGDLKVAHCGNPSCDSGNTVTPVDTAGFIGRHTSIAIGSDDNPVISYQDWDSFDLKVAHCGNPSCTSNNTISTVDSIGSLGESTSIAIGIDGNPVISYYDGTNDDLKVAHCGNPSCDSGNTIRAVGVQGDVGRHSSIAIGLDSNPFISYYDSTNLDLKTIHCGNMSCSGIITQRTVDSTGDVGRYTSTAFDKNGKSIISYYDVTNGDLKIVYCGDSFCEVGNTINLMDVNGNVGTHTSLTINNSDNPVISYYDFTNKDLKVAIDGTMLIFE
jgi:hypothetical protein